LGSFRRRKMIDHELVKRASKKQAEAEKEPWMEDIQTIRAMRKRNVDWKIIHELISEKHSLNIAQDVFERNANRLLKSLPKKSRGKISKHEVSDEVTPEVTLSQAVSS
jgi:hypothetical protein